MYVESRTKIANFPTPRVFNASDEGVPLGILYRRKGPKCLNDGATRRSKKFSDRFSRFDTIPAVTDTQPASQPPSQPATLPKLLRSTLKRRA